MVKAAKAKQPKFGEKASSELTKEKTLLDRNALLFVVFPLFISFAYDQSTCRALLQRIYLTAVKNNKRNDKRFNNRNYFLFFLMGIF